MPLYQVLYVCVCIFVSQRWMARFSKALLKLTSERGDTNAKLQSPTLLSFNQILIHDLCKTGTIAIQSKLQVAE